MREGTSTTRRGRLGGRPTRMGPAVHALIDHLGRRLVPALLAALGVTLLAAGLLHYTDPVTANPLPSVAAIASAGPAAPSPLLTFPPIASPSPPQRQRLAGGGRGRDAGRGARPRHRPAGHRAARRLRLLPAVQRGDVPPASSSQPGEPGATYLYAHARTGMFLPLLEASKRARREADAGDARPGLHERRPALPVRDRRGPAATRRRSTGRSARSARQLWLQTSRGPKGTTEKIQVIALPLEHGPADLARRIRRPTPSSASSPDPRPPDTDVVATGPAQIQPIRRRTTASRDGDHDDRCRDQPEARGLAAGERRAGLAHPEDAGDGGDAGQDAP